jgi:hypothetical protein
VPWLKALALWLLLGVLAVALGGVRQAWLAPALGDFRAHQAETLFFCAVIAAVAWPGMRWMRATRSQGLRVGLLWLALTVAFELGVFGLLLGHPWSELLADYNIAEGRLWPLVLATELVAPWLFAHGTEQERRR